VDLLDTVVSCQETTPRGPGGTTHGFLLSRADFRKWVQHTQARVTETPPSPSISVDLAKKITLLRKARGMTQYSLAALMGVPRSTIAFMETGRTLSIRKYIPRFAQALDVPEELFVNGLAEQDSTASVTADERAFIGSYRALPATLKLSVRKEVERALLRSRNQTEMTDKTAV